MGFQLQLLFAEPGTIYASASCSLQRASSQSPLLGAKSQVKLSAAAFPSHSHLLPDFEAALQMCPSTNSNLFHVTTQLILQPLPAYLAGICPLHSSGLTAL